MAEEAAALVTRLEARIDAHEQAMAKAVRGAYGAAAKIEQAFNASNDNIARKMRGKSGFSAAMSEGLAEVRGSVQSTAASVPVLGSALSALGPAGVGVAAVLGGVAIAMNRAAEAAQFSDDLSAAANKLFMTAEGLQEIRHAAEANDIAVPKAEAAIQSLNNALGALQAKVGDGKIRAALEKLGIPQDQIDSLRTAEDLLPILADHISALSTEAQQSQLAKKFGVEDLLPLLRKGSLGIAELRREARDLDLVLDEETVQSTADLNEKLRVADERLANASRRLSTSFVPALAATKDALADAAGAMAGFFKWIGESGSDERKVQEKVTQIAKAYERAQMAKSGYWGAIQAGASVLGAADPVRRERLSQQHRATGDRLQEDLKVIVARQNAAWERDRAKSTVTPGSAASAPSAVARSPRALAAETDSYEELYARIAGDSYELFVKEFKASIIAAGPGNADGKVKLPEVASDLVPSKEAMREALAPLIEAREMLANQIEYGLMAGFRNGVPGVVDYFGSVLEQRLARSLANSLADALGGLSGKGGLLGSLGGLFGSLLGHNAMGTNSWRGGLSVVGEMGPEIVNLPKGAQVVPNDILRAATRGGVAAPSSTMVVQPLYVNLAGAVVTQDLLDQVNTMVARGGIQAAQAGRAMARGDFNRKSKNAFP